MTTNESTPKLPITHGRPSIDNVTEISTPFPQVLYGEVTKGFGRGSRELGIPTANYPQEYCDSTLVSNLKPGIYYGYSMIYNKDGEEPQNDENVILPMVMSLGYNPYYNNEKKSAEVHVIHDFGRDFYGQKMKTLVLGFIRDEKSYNGLDDLIEDIRFDIQFALNTLKRPLFSSDHFKELFKNGE